MTFNLLRKLHDERKRLGFHSHFRSSWSFFIRLKVDSTSRVRLFMT